MGELNIKESDALARIMHRFLSRSAESDDLTRRGGTRLRVGGPRKRTVGYAEEAGGVATQSGRMISSLRSDEGGVAAVENLCIVRARSPVWCEHSCPKRDASVTSGSASFFSFSPLTCY